MSRQYGRRFRLEIGNETEGIGIGNLRVSFEIDKTINKEPNTAMIRVWNLNPGNRNRILSGEYKNVNLSVGYNELKLIYVGNVIKAKQVRDDVEWILELECGDGDIDYLKAFTAITLKAGSTDEDVIKKSAESFQNTAIGDMTFGTSKPLPRAKVLFGNTRDVLTQATKNTGSDWSIQDGELVVLPPDAVRNDEAIILSQESGMIGSPEQTDNGLALRCLINPSFQAGGLVRVVSIENFYNGDYKIQQVKFNGDAMGGDWLNELLVIGGKFQKIEKPKEDKK